MTDSENNTGLRSGLTKPATRDLRTYSFDPSLATRLETALINEVTVKVPWETLSPGPVGEYIEVIDFDPPSQRFYPPVDLDHPWALAQSGLSPSEGTPQFHQQMTYAVAMTTIKNFERALGRKSLWSPRIFQADGKVQSEFVERLRIYPHAMREANAYYSPEKKALLFGYFSATSDNPNMLPNGTVFSCLSFDIVAHETTHALLDGIHRHYINATNPDVLAFHEGFADIVALLQHFSFPEALRHQIAKTRGDLGTENLLAQLAQQFGQAIGSYGALRDALGAPDPVTHVWKPYVPSGAEMQTVFEPHARGSILVGAVFDAFVAIYKARTADLIRIATDGTGVLRPGAIHPDLVNRLAEAASKAAGHVLRMCIRALDYCPPVDITFGDYLRALITADFDLVPDDQLNYRIAFIEAFRRRGIYPQNVTVLSEESLRWSPPDNNLLNSVFSDSLGSLLRDWNMSSNRAEIYKKASDRRGRVHDDVKARIPGDARIAKELGIRADSSFDVHSARPARRTTPDGDLKTELVIEIVQTKYCNLDLQLLDARPEDPSTAFKFRGGTTLIIDLDESHSQSAVRYSIQKNIESLENRRRQRDFITGNQVSLGFVYGLETGEEPFALLHRTAEEAGLGGTYAK